MHGLLAGRYSQLEGESMHVLWKQAHPGTDKELGGIRRLRRRYRVKGCRKQGAA